MVCTVPDIHRPCLLTLVMPFRDFFCLLNFNKALSLNYSKLLFFFNKAKCSATTIVNDVKIYWIDYVGGTVSTA